jgi:tetratricopeptide (TPR) repeat protein
MAEGPLSRVEIFCCCAREDETWLRKLERHLSLLQRQGLISLWHDRLILPGADWAKALDTHLETASVILLLVSSDFLASDYSYGIEMKRALEREAAGEARVIPILVRSADWNGAPFAHLQILPTDAKPIAAWRNKDTAFADVAAGIRRVIVEELPQLTASAPRVALPKIWNIPYPRNPFFLGRESELLRIRQNLQTGQAMALSQPQAINGLGGIGKTQLALEYAYRHYQDYKVVLWARAESTEALVSSYITVASHLRLPEREAKEQDITVQAVKAWLQTHYDWLLILDNADELAWIPDFLPPSLGGHLLLTTRAAATGRLAHRMEIETLRPEHGALFLLRRAALIPVDADLSQASQEERELALHISQELGGLPLALDQAGAYLEETGMDLAGYWQIYQQHRAELLRERRGLVTDHPEPVATTWSLSFQRIKEKNPTAADLLRLFTYLAPDAIAEEILTEGAVVFGPVAVDVFLLNQAIEALRAYSLVQRDPKRKTLSIHRLVQAVLKDTQEEMERRSWAEQAMLAINVVFPDVALNMAPSTWLQCERLLPHALLAVQYIETDHIISEEAARLLHETAFFLEGRARYAEAERLYLLALRIKGDKLVSKHPDTISKLADLYLMQSKYVEAERLYQQALIIYQQQLGPGHPYTGNGLHDLGYLYHAQGKYVEAEPLYQQALTIYQQQLGPGHLDTANGLNDLAALYRDQGKYVEAEPLYQQALAITEQQLGREHLKTATTLVNLSVLYQYQGKWSAAEPLLKRVLSMREQQLGLEHPHVAHCLNYLANLYYQLGRYAEAEPLYQRALHINEQQLGSEHPDVASSLNGLANLSREQGGYAEAEPLYQRALHIREHALGSECPDTAETVHDLARLREVQGNSEEARTGYARALAIREQMLGALHPKTTETRKRFIVLLRAMGQHEEAAELEESQSEP